jgi:hypothetical protein
MATLTSTSTDAEVFAEYDDTASYEEDGSRALALRFITACRILNRRRPSMATRGEQQMSFETLQNQMKAAQDWLAANPASSAAGGRTRYISLENFRG